MIKDNITYLDICSPDEASRSGDSKFNSSIEAIASIIDNSRDGQASMVEVKVDLDKNNEPQSIQITDNGDGIDEAQQGKFACHNVTSKKDGQSSDKKGSTAGMYGHDLPFAPMHLGTNVKISTNQVGEKTQLVRWNSASAVLRKFGNQSNDPIQGTWKTDEQLSNIERESHYEALKSLWQAHGTNIDEDCHLSGTRVYVSNLHTGSDTKDPDWLSNLEGSLEIIFGAVMEGATEKNKALVPPAMVNQSTIQIFLTVTKEGKPQGFPKLLKPCHIVPTCNRSDYKRQNSRLRHHRDGYAPVRSTEKVVTATGSAVFNVTASVIADGPAGKDKTIQLLQSPKYGTRGVVVFIDGRLVAMREEQVELIIAKSEVFKSGKTGDRREGQHFQIVLSCHFKDSKGGEFNNRPEMADLLKLQPGKNSFVLKPALIDAIAKSKPVQTILKEIKRAQEEGAATLPATYQDFIDEWKKAKGNKVLARISEVIYGDTDTSDPKNITLKVKGEMDPSNPELFSFDEKSSTILWNFDSDAHLFGESKDVSGGNVDANIWKICRSLFDDLNKASGNKFVSHIDMAKQAGVQPAKHRTPLFKNDAVKVDWNQ